MLYILDFFFNEDWYLKTIDIAHDHYGWYLAWGDAVWLPWMYTLQVRIFEGFGGCCFESLDSPIFRDSTLPLTLLTCPTLTWLPFCSWLPSVTTFSVTPMTKDTSSVRTQVLLSGVSLQGTTGDVDWVTSFRYIKASYKTADGKEHQSHLLTSGYWGLSRHFNYFGDLIFSFSSCFACGFEYVAVCPFLTTQATSCPTSTFLT